MGKKTIPVSLVIIAGLFYAATSYGDDKSTDRASQLKSAAEQSGAELRGAHSEGKRVIMDTLYGGEDPTAGRGEEGDSGPNAFSRLGEWREEAANEFDYLSNPSEFMDPTRPAFVKIVNPEGEVEEVVELAAPDAEVELKLNQILISGKRKVAVINGEVLSPGQEIESYKITEITPGVVTLENEEGDKKELSLFSESFSGIVKRQKKEEGSNE